MKKGQFVKKKVIFKLKMGENDQILPRSEIFLAVVHPTKCRNTNLIIVEDFLGLNL